MLEGGCGIALLQEPYATNGVVRGLPGGFRVFTDLRRNAAIVVNNPSYDCVVLDSSQLGVCVSIEGEFGRLVVASVYCKYSEPLEPYLLYMDKLLLLASSSSLILGMDANASSSMWFSKVSRHSSGYQSHTRGEVLSEWVEANSLHILNEPSEWYTFDGPGGVSDIDVSFMNEAANRTFNVRWEIRGGWGLSDHNLIQIMVTPKSPPSAYESPLRRWRTSGIDWNQYGRSVREAVLEIPLSEFEDFGVDEQISRLYDVVWEVNNSVLGKFESFRVRKLKWWTKELTMKRRAVRRLRRKFQRARQSNSDGLSQIRYEFSCVMRDYKQMLVKTKEEEWRNFIGENRNDPWGQVYKICRGRKREDITSLRVGDTVLSTWRDCAGVLLGAFFPRAEARVSQTCEVPVPPLDEGELGYAFGLVRCKRSPGFDGLNGEMCKSMWKFIPEYLEAIYNKCVWEGYFPREWKRARVVPLLKSPDKIRSDPRSYRGISLLPVLGKVLERVMVERLQDLTRDMWSDRQYGFRKGRSVEDAWMYVQSAVRENVNEYVLGIFVDFKGAFDYLIWDRVIERLEELGCPEVTLWRSYFSDRKASIVGMNGSVEIGVARGCPQGSICGPYIWNLMMDSLLGQLEPVCKCCAYADDLLLLVEGHSRSEIERAGGRFLEIVHSWGVGVGVDISMDKTVTMLLKGRLSPARPPIVRVNGVSIKYMTQVKYLGLTMRERMCFTPHLVSVKERLLATVGKVRRVLRSDWGLGRRAVRTIYRGLFVACATYGAAVWWELATTVFGRQKLLSVQRCMMLACLPVCRTVSTDAMQVLLGAPPLDLIVIQRAVAFRLRRGLSVSLLQNNLISDLDVEREGYLGSKRLLEDRVKIRWQDRWDNSPNGRVTYEYIRDVRFVEENPDFRFCLSLGFLLTGHGPLNAFLHQRHLSDTPECMCGARVEDWAHVIALCPMYSDIRNLEGMGISWTNGRLDVSGVISTSPNTEQLGSFDRFARELFRRRRQLAENRG